MGTEESFDRRTVSFTGITREAIENNRSREAIKNSPLAGKILCDDALAASLDAMLAD